MWREGKAIICIYHNPGGRRGGIRPRLRTFCLTRADSPFPPLFLLAPFPLFSSPFGGGGGSINLSAKSSRRPKGKKWGEGGGEKKRKISFPSFLPFGKSLFLRGWVGKDGVCKGGGGGGGKDAEIHFSATTTFPHPRKALPPSTSALWLGGGREGSRLWQKRDRGTPDSLREM